MTVSSAMLRSAWLSWLCSVLISWVSAVRKETPSSFSIWKAPRLRVMIVCASEWRM